MKDKTTPVLEKPPGKVTASDGVPGVTDPKALALDGLYLSGQVIGRQRREFVGKEGKASRFVIVLSILTKDGVHKPERWSDVPAPSDVPLIGDHVTLNVRITLFSSKGGGTGYRLNWGPDNAGTDF